MNAAAIQEFVRLQPFRPFEVVLSGGDRFRVHKREHVVLMRRNIVIGYPSTRGDRLPDDFVMRPYADVEDIKPLRTGLSPGRRVRKG